MSSRSNRSSKQAEARVVTPERGAPLEPIRVVERVLTRPDGTKVRVEVPVYPPFELRKPPAVPEAPRRRKLGSRRRDESDGAA
jgi:hypothetical protein